MKPVGLVGVVAYWLLCSSVVVLSEVDELIHNYVVTGDLPDGEQELKIKFRDVLLREESVKEDSPNPHHKLTLILRQVAKGPDFLQLVYKSNERDGVKKLRLLDCEMMNSWKTTDEFRTNFQRQLEQAGVQMPIIPQKKAPVALGGHDDYELMNLEDFDLDFDPVEREPVHKEVIDLNPRFPDLLNITVRMIRNDGKGDRLIEEYKEALDVGGLERQCNRFHRRLKRSILEKQKQREEESLHSGQTSRRRRETFPFGIMPGTYWCGFDKVANRRSSIGAHAGTDVCCRQHDHCPVLIKAMTSNYGLFNYRMSTISHCSCDERFRSCLKQTNTGSADFVGKLFFNVVQTKCFVLKTEKTCGKRSWWGKCEKEEFKKQAYLRDPLPY